MPLTGTFRARHRTNRGAWDASGCMTLLCVLMLAWLAATEPNRLSAQGRSDTLLNRDWRFQRGNIAGADAPDFVDSTWEHIGLPHSFGIPYFGTSQFYVGYGWYRRHLELPALSSNDDYALDFDAAFQEAEIWVNGQRVGKHLGGYTGFEVEITPALHKGDNVIAVRVNNLWNPQLNPRAGEHNFNGGIYRDVHLIHTDRLHVDWYGTAITTPGLTEAQGPVHIATDVRNNSSIAEKFELKTTIRNAGGTVVARATSKAAVAAQRVVSVPQQTTVTSPAFWSPAQPTLYTAETQILVRGHEIDRYTTTFGFRNIRWTADNGLEVNGKRLYFHGADVHQDHAGWGDAVADNGIRRDVRMIKDAGMDFIRGSHYPHSPVFSDACDREGILLWEENSFWGTGGSHEEGKWTASAYPPHIEDQAAFEANVKQSLVEMIRIHRNHPSILTWSMGNEVFFSDADLMPKVRAFLAQLVAEAHTLDPSRPAAIGGVQRGEIDRIGDVAGYNGDGATLFLNPGVASAVTEYGSTVAVRPGAYEPGYGDLSGQPEFHWRGGQALWAGFDHGSIFPAMGKMGMIDYFRLPKRQWFWYRNAYRGIAPPRWPQQGTPAALTLESNHGGGQLRADGSDDTQIIVRVVDKSGLLLANTLPIELRILSGPGEFPTGRIIRFSPGGAIPIIDGVAAMEFHVYQSGTTELEAIAPGLPPARLSIQAIGGPPFLPGVTSLAADRTYLPQPASGAKSTVRELALNRPTSASSNAPTHTSDQANDGDSMTWWQPLQADSGDPWWQLDLEGDCHISKVSLRLKGDPNLSVLLSVPDEHGSWRKIAQGTALEWSEGLVQIPSGTISRFLRFNCAASAKTAPQILEVQVQGSPAE